jgi:hypothetical protein
VAERIVKGTDAIEYPLVYYSTTDMIVPDPIGALYGSGLALFGELI